MIRQKQILFDFFCRSGSKRHDEVVTLLRLYGPLNFGPMPNAGANQLLATRAVLTTSDTCAAVITAAAHPDPQEKRYQRRSRDHHNQRNLL